ncbi:MAG TPA: hypothetical protein VFC44_18800 [Candidatus Saccharimonadales bacterium]|nr:hypothetical protein [Candidatus Saccharimonadales bacterium]
MERYIAQMADEALGDMCGPEPLEYRVKLAQSRFSFVSSDHFLKTAPPEIGQNITTLIAMEGKNTDHAAGLIRELIHAILAEFARQDGRAEARRSQG